MGVQYMCCFSRVLLCVLCVCVLLVTQCKMESSSNVDNSEEDEREVNDVCDIKGCNCSKTAKYWLVVNCTFDSKQIVDLKPGLLNKHVSELSVTGGLELRFHSQVFTTLVNIQRIRIDGTKNITVKKHAFVNLTVNSLLVQITSCDSLLLETLAFKNMVKGPVTAEISRCGYVRVQKSVFSFLQEAKFSEIPLLELEEGTFMMQPREIGAHGPVTTIKFHKVLIPSLPKDTFKSTLAEVMFLESEVREVMTEAFSGNTITAVTIANSSLHRIHRAAFSERSLLENLQLYGCHVKVMESGAVLSATANLTVQYCRIDTIHTRAVNAIVAKVSITDSHITTIHSRGLSLNDWTRVVIDNNVFEHMDQTSMEIQSRSQNEFSFSRNEIYTIDSGAMNFMSNVTPDIYPRFEDNKFRHACLCEMNSWLLDIIGTKSSNFLYKNYCTVDAVLAGCYEVSTGLVNMKNFTDTICRDEEGKELHCKTFSSDGNVVNKNVSTDGKDNSNDLILGLVLGLVLIIAVSGTVVILLIHGGLWLKRKGYCVRFHKEFHPYRTEENSTEIEDIIVNVEKVPENHLPEELSQDLLQALREKLEDPLTYNEAREMIERLYDHFIIEDSYTNNNRQEEETHLYEELGNLNQQNPDQDKTPTRPFSFLRLIEERFNLIPNEQQINKTVNLVGEYSEPTDAEVHLYSELPQNKEGKQNEINEGLTQIGESSTQRSNGSGRMAYRPLPDKPRPKNDPGEGPSTKF